MTDLRGDITKLVIFPDDKAKVDDKGTRPRVLSKTAAAYYNGYGESTTKDEAEAIEKDKDKDKDKGNGSGGGGGSGTGSPDAGDKLAVGDEVPGFDGLQDCDTGQCVHANFTGQAVVPPGWKSACDAGEEYAEENKPDCLMVLTYYLNGNPPQYKYFWSISELKNIAMAMLESVANRGVPMTAEQINKAENGTVYYDQAAYNSYKSWINSFEPCTYKGAGGYGFSVGEKGGDEVSRIIISQGYPDFKNNSIYNEYCQSNPPQIEWPSDMCSEVVFDKDNGTFAPSCAKYDKNLPASVNKEQTKLELCDKDGNKVVIKNTLFGLEVTQEKYGITSLIDRDSHKVISQTLTENTVIH